MEIHANEENEDPICIPEYNEHETWTVKYGGGSPELDRRPPSLSLSLFSDVCTRTRTTSKQVTKGKGGGHKGKNTTPLGVNDRSTPTLGKSTSSPDL